MAQAAETTLILVDAEGRVTDDRTKAVRGELLETLPDGTTRSTLFVLDRDVANGSKSAA